MSHSYYLTPVEPSFQHFSIRLPGANCQICLLFTERYQSQKTRKRLKCIHSQINSSKHIKINWFSDCKWSQHYSKFPSTILHLRKVYLYLARQYNLILLLCATKLMLSTKIILNYTFITKYDITLNCRIPSPLNIQRKRLLQQSRSPLLTLYKYIPRSKSVFLKG